MEISRSILALSLVLVGLAGFLTGKLLGGAGADPTREKPALGKRSEAPWRWSDLESANGSRFAENLRAVGCPEPVIRRIVTPSNDASPIVAATLAAAGTPAPSLAMSAPSPAADSGAIVAPEGNAPIPVAFQPLPQDAKMTPSQQAQLHAIQEQFVADIGGAEQDPSSPDYLEKWGKAQRRSDERFRAAFGRAAFVCRQIVATRADGNPSPSLAPSP